MNRQQRRAAARAAPNAARDDGAVDRLIALCASLHAAGRLEEAVSSYRKLIGLRPNLAEAYCNLGAALKGLGRNEDAVSAYRDAIRLRPAYAEAYSNLGIALKDLGQSAEGVAACRQAVAFGPEMAETYNNLGAALENFGARDEAVAAYRQAVARKPDFLAAMVNLGAALQRVARMAEAADCYEAALRLNPGDAKIHKYLLACTLYREDLARERIADLYRRFGGAFDRPPVPSRPRPQAAERKLRIGYLSSDLRQHPVAGYLLPGLRHHDRSRFSIHFYSLVAQPDGTTGAFRAIADGWHDVTGLDDAAIAERVRADGIDILVFLAGHFDDNRPTVAAWRAAPVQISMCDAATSGLAEMDYVVTDPWLHPRDNRALYTETPLRLPQFYLTEFPGDLPAVDETERQGPPVFGCFNNPEKITPSALALWGRILSAVPDGRLMLKFTDYYNSDDLRGRFLALLTAAGAQAEQVEFVREKEPRWDFLSRHNRIDVALDTFPFSGSTTTFQTLVMGVPVVTWPHERFASRFTAAMLREVGLSELIAASGDEYVALAVAVAGDRGRWRRRRGEIRGRLAASALCDGRRWARQVERLYRAAWRRSCAPVEGEAERLVARATAAVGAGRLAEAVAALERLVRVRPDFAAAHSDLGTLLGRLGRGEDAVAAFRRAVALDPGFARAWSNLGNILKDLGQGAEAVAAHRRAVALEPGLAEAWSNLGAALKSQNDLDDAVAAYRQALALRPGLADAWTNLGNALLAQGATDGAIEAQRKAIALRPDYAEAHNNLGNALERWGDRDAAIAAYRRAADLNPGYLEPLVNLGWSLQRLIRQDDAAACYEAALRLKPDDAEIHRHALLCATYRHDSGAEALHRRFGRTFDRPLALRPRPAAAAERKLRIGYLSSDLRRHPVADNLLPVLRHHDRSLFSVHLYSLVDKPDETTEDFRALADGWHDVAGLDDAAIAERIRADGIDILLCLAGRFDDNRPLVCTWRAAPVQISMYEVATSGLAEMDYIIVDNWLLPRPVEEYFTETPLRLPQFFVSEFPADLPAVDEPPRRGPPVFGCFNNPQKITSPMLALWGRILCARPDATLVLQYLDSYGSGALRNAVLAPLTGAGARSEQVRFVTTRTSRREFLALHMAVDIALDTGPFSGSTTTFQALAAGVPVVTWPQERMVSRWAAAMLRRVGLTETIAASGDDYVAAAVAAAADVERWRQRRGEIRERLAASALCDCRGWTRHIERLYRAAWRRNYARL